MELLLHLLDADAAGARERLAQAVGDRVEQDRLVDLATRMELLLHLLDANAAGARERADVVALLRDEVRVAHRDVLVHILLLTQTVERYGLVGRALADDVITHTASGPDADDRMSLNQTGGNDIIHHLVRLIEHLLCHGAARLIFEDVRVPLVRVFPAQIVQAEERAPIDVLADFIQVVLLEGNVPSSNWLRRGALSEINLQALGLRLLDREPLLVHEPLVVLGADLVVLVLDVVQVVLGAGPNQRLHYGHSAGGVQDVDRLLALRRELHRGVALRRRRAADEERLLEALGLHLLRNVNHLVKRKSNQS